MSSEAITNDYVDNLRCYMCNKHIDITNNEYQVIQVHNMVEGTYCCRISDDKVMTYICSDCYGKIANIKSGEIY